MASSAIQPPLCCSCILSYSYLCRSLISASTEPLFLCPVLLRCRCLPLEMTLQRYLLNLLMILLQLAGVYTWVIYDRIPFSVGNHAASLYTCGVRTQLHTQQQTLPHTPLRFPHSYSKQVLSSRVMLVGKYRALAISLFLCLPCSKSTCLLRHDT